MIVTWPYYFTNSVMTKNVSAGDTFTIHKINQESSNLIYQGIVAQGVKNLSLAPIFQQFVKPYDYNIDNGNPSYEDMVSPMLFYVNDGKNLSTYNVSWGYDWIYGVNKLLNIQLGNVQDYYSYYLPIIVYAYARQIDVVQNNNVIYNAIYTKDQTFVLYYNGQLDGLLDPSLDVHFKIYSGSQIQDTILHPLYCWEDYTHCLYFLKRDGSIGWVFCKGGNGQKINAEKSQIVISSPYSIPRIENYQIQHYRSWKFNTGFLTRQQAYKLSDLFVSPRVWMVDMDGNLIANVIVTDKSFEIKDKRISEAPISYTINVREAETKSTIVP